MNTNVANMLQNLLNFDLCCEEIDWLLKFRFSELLKEPYLIGTDCFCIHVSVSVKHAQM